MPITILGLPGSGTTFLGRLLRGRGVLAAPVGAGGGEPRSLQGINAEILARHGGRWDLPPAFPEDWATSSTIAPLRTAATALLGRFSHLEPWAWADPTTSLTFPFWRSVDPTLMPVVVIRNPLEVMLSLRSRTDCSFPAAIDLVRRYLQAILRTTQRHRRVVTHYAAYAQDAGAEAARVLWMLGCRLTTPHEETRGFSKVLRSARFSMRHLDEFALPTDIIEAYRELCMEAQFRDNKEEVAASIDPQGITWLRQGSGGGEAGSASSVALAATVQKLQDEVSRLRGDLADREESLHEVVEDLRFMLSHLSVDPKKLGYREMVRRARQLLRQHAPKGAVVAVISKGDDALLRHGHCTAWHFPQDNSGAYPGWYPGCDLAATAHLETLRARGATHLFVPEPYAWWLKTYPGFQRHLDRWHTMVVSQTDVGTLYALGHLSGYDAGKPPLAEELEKLATALGRPPQVLDLADDEWAGDTFPGAAVFRPLGKLADGPDVVVPYMDASIDVVAVSAPTPRLLEEARRIATRAVVHCDGQPRVEWILPPSNGQHPSVSVVIPVFNQWRLTRACLEAVWRGVPPGCELEVVVVDDASTDETPMGLAALAAAQPRLKVLRSETNLGFVGGCNRAAAAATGDILVFLNNDTVPLPGWLGPLLRTFRQFPRVGAVGGKLLFPDGTLQEAGGIVFSDASACHFGRGELNAQAPLFNFVREVDYASGALLATPRTLFASLGGFDPDFAPGYYEDTDYCFRLRQQGHAVLYQPASAVVHLEGATAGTNHAQGMKRHQEINRIRFQSKQAAALQRQRPRPIHIDSNAWNELARRIGTGVDA